VSHIDPHLCTHLIYTFFGILPDGSLRVIDPYLDLEENWGRGNIKKFNDLKKINPKLKTLAAVGGWNEGSGNFSVVAKSPAKRRRFAREAAQFVLKHGFDGLDMDWEYPAQRDGNSKQDRLNFIHLLGDIKRELAPYGLLLTGAVGAAEFSASLSYDIPKITK
jgi:chitinase